MTCMSMVESVRVERRCWLGRGPSGDVVSLVHFEISWTDPNGHRLTNTKMFDGVELLDLPRGATPMVAHIYTLPYPGHPGACTPAIAYLLRVYDYEKDLEDVVARLLVRTPEQTHGDPDRIWESPVPGESGPGIYPLPIYDDRDEPFP